MRYQQLLPSVITVSLLWSCLTAICGEIQTNIPLSLKTALTTTDELEQKPVTFDGLSHRLDYIHDNFHNVMQSRTEATDTFLSQGVEPVGAVTPSRFRLGLYIESKVDEGFKLRFDPDFEAEINLPNLEKRWKIFITAKEIDEMPDTNPSEREKGFSAGVRKDIKNLPIKFDAGVRLRWLPEGFVKLSWKKNWKTGNWRIIPSQKAFYETDEGFGEVTALTTRRSLGANSRGIFSTASAVKWTEETHGVEWSQSISLGYIGETLEKDHRRKNIKKSDAARGVGMKIAVYGHKSGSGVIDRHRLSFVHRRPLYKKWVYLEITPEVQWKNDNEWAAEYTLRIGFDMLFWGTKDR